MNHPMMNHYRFFQGKRNGRNQRVLFCWTTSRDSKGFFWTWVQVIGKHSFKRMKVSKRRKRNAVKALALRRFEAQVDFKEAQRLAKAFAGVE